MNQDGEPVSKKSRWGTNRYVYNPANPMGLTLILISLIVAVVMMVLMEKHAGPFAPPPEPTPWNPQPPEEQPWPFPSASPTHAPSAWDTAPSGPSPTH
ncbi:hypothetical protein ACFXPZ_04365 [Streptomyces sp. NPDC059101]|uniref:hypothetical protein n=1 Tax=unclassified Streptomyces TaxID=2593676 RepID=UPI0015E151A4|nr:hypothetical protein [Streptomyces sp. CB02959]